MPITALTPLHRALEAGVHGDALRALFTSDAVVVEHPNLIAPTGGTRDLDDVVAASVRGAHVLTRQRLALVDAHEHGSTAIARLTWTGVVAADVGPLRAGQVLTAHVAQFATVREGRIARLETYDCYEPLHDAQ